MPSNRRLPRTVRNTVPSIMSGFMDNSGSRYASLGAKVPTIPALEQPPAPKHFPFPNTPVDNDVFFELLMFAFTMLCTGLQFLHLYRTVWWLPNSHTNQALNFYLIDVYLVAFILLLLSRRLIYIAGCYLMNCLVSKKIQDIAFVGLRIFLSVQILGLLVTFAFFLVQSHSFSIINISYLCYPISVYLILFGFQISPFFELSDKNGTLPPLHACSSDANNIRLEVENLRANFNNRMKQILFNSILNAYYSGFIPCCFAQSFLHYDIYWATQHVIFIFLSCFVAYSVQILSLRYCDVLHRSALHLGNWDKLETKNMLLVNNVWNPDTLWPYGALVRHGRDLYRAQGECNSGEPGSTMGSRFYNLFKNPSTSLKYLMFLHIIMIFWQLYLLFFSVYWYNIISLAFVLFFNYYILYKVVRDYLVSHNMYKEELLMHDKVNIR